MTKNSEQKRKEALKRMAERMSVRDIWDSTGVTPRGIRTIAGRYAPDYLDWMEKQVCADYDRIGRRKAMYRWVLTRGMMDDILASQGVPMKSDAWQGKRGGCPRTEDDINPLMAKFLAMPVPNEI